MIFLPILMSIGSIENNSDKIYVREHCFWKKICNRYIAPESINHTSKLRAFRYGELTLSACVTMKNKFKDKRSLTRTNVALVASLDNLLLEWFQLTLTNNLGLGFRGNQSRVDNQRVLPEGSAAAWTKRSVLLDRLPNSQTSRERDHWTSGLRHIANPTDFSIFSDWFQSIWHFSRRNWLTIRYTVWKRYPSESSMIVHRRDTPERYRTFGRRRAKQIVLQQRPKLTRPHGWQQQPSSASILPRIQDAILTEFFSLCRKGNYKKRRPRWVDAIWSKGRPLRRPVGRPRTNWYPEKTFGETPTWDTTTSSLAWCLIGRQSSWFLSLSVSIPFLSFSFYASSSRARLTYTRPLPLSGFPPPSLACAHYFTCSLQLIYLLEIFPSRSVALPRLD